MQDQLLTREGALKKLAAHVLNSVVLVNSPPRVRSADCETMAMVTTVAVIRACQVGFH